MILSGSGTQLQMQRVMKFRLLLPQIKRALIVLQNSYNLYSYMTPPWNLIPDIYSYIFFNHSLSVLYCIVCTRTSTLLIHKFLYLQAPSTKNHSLYIPYCTAERGWRVLGWQNQAVLITFIIRKRWKNALKYKSGPRNAVVYMYFQRSFALEEKTAAGLSIGGWLWIDGKKMYPPPPPINQDFFWPRQICLLLRENAFLAMRRGEL